MNMRERAQFIREKMEGCDVVIFIRAADWGTTIGELTNQLNGDTARYSENGHEVLRIVSKSGKGEKLPNVITFFGPVNGNWEPICAKIVPDDLGFKVIGAYYDAI